MEDEATPQPADLFFDTDRSGLHGDVVDWMLHQPEVTRCFDDWAGRVRALDDGFTLRLGAFALMHGFDSGEALSEADPHTLFAAANADRAHVLREFRVSTLAEGRRLGRACLTLRRRPESLIRHCRIPPHRPFRLPCQGPPSTIGAVNPALSAMVAPRRDKFRDKSAN